MYGDVYYNLHTVAVTKARPKLLESRFWRLLVRHTLHQMRLLLIVIKKRLVSQQVVLIVKTE